MDNINDWSQCNVLAVVEEARKGNQDAINAALDRLADIASPKRQSMVVLVTDDGHWGRGKDVPDAASKLKKLANPKTIVRGWLVYNDPQPFVDGAGYLVSEANSITFKLGFLGKLDGICS